MTDISSKCCRFFMVLFIFFGLSQIPVDAKDNLSVNCEIPDWQNIEFLDINDAFNIALINNSNIKAFASKLEQAKHRLLQAKSYYLPSINFESKLANNELDKEIKNKSNIYQLGVTTSWIIFDGFSRKFKNIIAEYDEKIALTSIDEASRLLLLSVCKFFYDAQFFREKITIAKADQAFNKHQLEEIEAKYHMGFASIKDVLNFKIRLNNAKLISKNEENNYKIAMLNLASLLGISDPNFTSIVKLAPLLLKIDENLILQDWNNLVDIAIEKRHDINLHKLLIEQANANIFEKKNFDYPKIFISASFNAKREGDMHFCSDNFSYSACLGLSYNIFDGGLNIARIREANEKKNELNNILNNLIISTKAEIRASILEVCNAQMEVRLQQENNKLAEKMRNLVEKEYKSNCSSLLQLNEAQNNLIKSSCQLAKAIIDFKRSLVELNIYKGEQIY